MSEIDKEELMRIYHYIDIRTLLLLAKVSKSEEELNELVRIIAKREEEERG